MKNLNWFALGLVCTVTYCALAAQDAQDGGGVFAKTWGDIAVANCLEPKLKAHHALVARERDVIYFHYNERTEQDYFNCSHGHVQHLAIGGADMTT